MKMCIQADLDATDALRHMNKNNSERAVCITHPLAPISTSFLFVFDTEWVMSTCEHQGRDTVLHTGLKIHWRVEGLPWVPARPTLGSRFFSGLCQVPVHKTVSAGFPRVFRFPQLLL